MMLASPSPDLWRDAALPRGMARWRKSAALQRKYAGRLKRIASEIERIIEAHEPDDLASLAQVERQLEKYAELLEPWAYRTARVMVDELNVQDFNHWRRHAQEMERELVREITSAPVGPVFRDFMRSQVSLITSLPRRAAERVHRLTIEGLSDAARAKEIAKEIERSGHVARTRAMLIARTEIARTQSALVMARAQHVGSEGYIWRTMRDAFVRPAIFERHFAQLNTPAKGSHRLLEGTFVPWDDPPIAGSSGERAHAGMIYNCRCYCEPVIPDL